MFSKLFNKKKAIKKPNWFLCVLKFIVIFAIVGAIFFAFSADTFVLSYILPGEGNYINTYISQISQYGYDGFTEEELLLIENLVATKQAMYDMPAVISIDGEVIDDSSYAVSTLVMDDSRPLTAGDKAFIMHWTPENNPEIQKLYDYHCDMGLFHYYTFHVEDYYIDFDTHTLYYGKVSVLKNSGPFIVFTEVAIGPFPSENVVEVIDLTPADSSVLEGLTHVDNNNYDDNYTLTIFSITGTADGGETTDNSQFLINGEYHKLEAKYNNYFTNEIICKVIYGWYALFVGIVVLIAALIVGTIKFFSDKSTYKIFEYRRSTTNAMAHDLKTPLAIAALSVDNLKDTLKTDAERAEYHANEIEDSIHYMDQLISNIMDFSNSETMDRKYTKENVDVSNELKSHKKTIAKVLESRNLKLEINGSATRVTNKKIWNQALFNLIDNAAKYASSDSTITVNLGSDEITITNNVDKDIPNVNKLTEPFVKGDENRGENSGSGLGLAIADNNLRTLGYRLKLQCINKKFVVTIK